MPRETNARQQVNKSVVKSAALPRIAGGRDAGLPEKRGWMHRDDPNRSLGAQDARGRNRVRLAREHAPGLRTGTLSLLTLIVPGVRADDFCVRCLFGFARSRVWEAAPKCVDAESHREILFGFASDRTRIDCHAAWHAR